MQVHMNDLLLIEHEEAHLQEQQELTKTIVEA